MFSLNIKLFLIGPLIFCCLQVFGAYRWSDNNFRQEAVDAKHILKIRGSAHGLKLVLDIYRPFDSPVLLDWNIVYKGKKYDHRAMGGFHLTNTGFEIELKGQNIPNQVLFNMETRKVTVDNKTVRRRTIRYSVIPEGSYRFDSGRASDKFVFEPSVPTPVRFFSFFLGGGNFKNIFSTSSVKPHIKVPSKTTTHHADKYKLRRETPSPKSGADLNIEQASEEFRNAVWAMVNGRNKPTIQEMSTLLKGEFSSNPFANYKIFASERHIESIPIELPKVIAQLERAFPNAYFYAMGRDAYLIGDALDAYYSLKGLTDRIKRLNISNPVFISPTSDEFLREFLKVNGLDAAEFMADKQARSRIVVDVTSYSPRSQSRFVMKELYDHWMEMGGKVRELLPKINFVDVAGYGSRHQNISPDLNRAGFFNKISASPEKFDMGPPEIMSLKANDLLYPATFWHPMYDGFERDPKTGVVDSTIGKGFAGNSHISLNERLGMLWELVETQRLISSADFDRAVEKELIEQRTSPRTDIGRGFRCSAAFR